MEKAVAWHPNSSVPLSSLENAGPFCNGRSLFARKFTYLWVEPVGSLGDLSKICIGQTAQDCQGLKANTLEGSKFPGRMEPKVCLWKQGK